MQIEHIRNILSQNLWLSPDQLWRFGQLWQSSQRTRRRRAKLCTRNGTAEYPWYIDRCALMINIAKPTRWNQNTFIHSWFSTVLPCSSHFPLFLYCFPTVFLYFLNSLIFSRVSLIPPRRDGSIRANRRPQTETKFVVKRQTYKFELTKSRSRPTTGSRIWCHLFCLTRLVVRYLLLSSGLWASAVHHVVLRALSIGEQPFQLRLYCRVCPPIIFAKWCNIFQDPNTWFM